MASSSCYSKHYRILLILSVSLMLNRGASADSCVDCHRDPTFRVKNKKLFDYFRQWEGSIHDEAGVSCIDCHTGNSNAADKETAHAGMLPPSDPKSRVSYKNVPKTCSDCHFDVYENFIQSKHYKALMEKDIGPNCVTCHGSLSTEIYFSSAVVKTCANCHNSETKNHPEIVETADQILHRLSVSGMYRKWTSLHYESAGTPEVMKNTDALYQGIARSWHQFDFEQTDRDSESLMLELKSLYNAARKEEREKGSRKPKP